jgi:hypothetical protein
MIQSPRVVSPTVRNRPNRVAEFLTLYRIDKTTYRQNDQLGAADRRQNFDGQSAGAFTVGVTFTGSAQAPSRSLKPIGGARVLHGLGLSHINRLLKM